MRGVSRVALARLVLGVAEHGLSTVDVGGAEQEPTGLQCCGAGLVLETMVEDVDG